MNKIATPQDLDTELQTLVQANRRGSTRQDIAERLIGLAHRLAADDPAASVKEASKLAKAGLPDLKKMSDALSKAYPYGKHAQGSAEDHVRNVSSMLYTSCKSLIKDLGELRRTV